MSDGIVIPLDVDDTKARAKVSRLKQQTSDAGRAYAQQGAMAARMGGPMGGVIGRATGGFGMGMGMGIAGAGFAAAGIAFNAMLEAQNRTVERARERAEYQNQVAEGRRSAGLTRRSFEAGSASIVPQLRRLATSYARDSMGLTGAKNDINNIVSATGVNEMEATESVLEARNARVSGTDVARLVGTGEFSASDAADALRQFGSPERALAARMRVSVSEAGQALAASSTVNNSSGIKMLEAKIDNVTSGRASAAQAEMNAEALNPEDENKQKLRNSVNANIRVMSAAASAQMECVGALKDLAMMLGMGAGSESTKLENYKEVTRE